MWLCQNIWVAIKGLEPTVVISKWGGAFWVYRGGQGPTLGLSRGAGSPLWAQGLSLDLSSILGDFRCIQESKRDLVDLFKGSGNHFCYSGARSPFGAYPRGQESTFGLSSWPLVQISWKQNFVFEICEPRVNCGEKQQTELQPFVLTKHPNIPAYGSTPPCTRS